MYVLVFAISVNIKSNKGIFGHTTKPESQRVSRKLEGCVKAEIKLDDRVMENRSRSKWLKGGILMFAEKERSGLKILWGWELELSTLNMQ